MAILSDTSKNSMRYRISMGNEYNTRLLSGLNMVGSSSGTGIDPATGIVELARTMRAFSQGQIDNLAYVQERAVDDNG